MPLNYLGDVQVIPQIIKYFKTKTGKCPFLEWYDLQDPETKYIIDSRLKRVSRGNFGDYSGKGLNGIFELIFDHAGALRVYFGKKSLECVVILGGGLKRGQQKDIDKAKDCWKEFERGNHGMSD